MTLRITLIFCSVLAISSCQQKKDSKLSEVKKIRKEADKSTGTGNAFVQAAKIDITEPAAVYFHPDSVKLQKLEETRGDKFFEDAEKSMGNLSSSRDYMIRNKIRVIETEARLLTFRKADGTVNTIDLSSPEYTWGLFLFNGTDNPIQVDMAKPEKQTTTYMRK